MRWPGLTVEAIASLGNAYEQTCLVAMEVMNRAYPDDPELRVKKFVEYREDIRRGVCQSLVANGCPPAEAGGWLQTIIEHQAKFRMAEGRRQDAEASGGSSAVN